MKYLMQYFHPDNMSSAEKLKIELAKVREEFKMSESDCGSARVQGIGYDFGFITLFFFICMHLYDFIFHYTSVLCIWHAHFTDRLIGQKFNSTFRLVLSVALQTVF